MPFTLQSMFYRYNYKSNDVFHSPNSLWSFKKFEIEIDRREHTVSMYTTAYNLWTFTWFVHFELPFRLKGTEQIHTKKFSKFPSNIYSILFAYHLYLLTCLLSLSSFVFLYFTKKHQLINVFFLNVLGQIGIESDILLGQGKRIWMSVI